MARKKERNAASLGRRKAGALSRSTGSKPPSDVAAVRGKSDAIPPRTSDSVSSGIDVVDISDIKNDQKFRALVLGFLAPKSVKKARLAWVEVLTAIRWYRGFKQCTSFVTQPHEALPRLKLGLKLANDLKDWLHNIDGTARDLLLWQLDKRRKELIGRRRKAPSGASALTRSLRPAERELRQNVDLLVGYLERTVAATPKGKRGPATEHIHDLVGYLAQIWRRHTGRSIGFVKKKVETDSSGFIKAVCKKADSGFSEAELNTALRKVLDPKSGAEFTDRSRRNSAPVCR